MSAAPMPGLPRFVEVGTGAASGNTAVVMLHGIGGGRHAFDRQMMPLVEAGYRAVSWDMPGYGASALVEAYDFATLADRCIALIDHLAARRVVLLGHSLGGMIAQEVMARAPDRVAALVLAGTSAAFGKPDGAWQRAFVEERTAPLDAGASMGDLARSLVAQMVAKTATAVAIDEAVTVMSSVPPATYRIALQALMGFDRREQLATLHLPVLLIAGDEDRNAAPTVMAGMRDRLPDAEMVVLERCGHLLPMERPEAFNAALLAFLARSAPLSGASP